VTTPGTVRRSGGAPSSAPTSNARVEVSPRRVRAHLGGEVVLDSTAALLVWELPHYPSYYIPVADIRAELEAIETENPGPHGEVHYTVRLGEHEAVGAARRYPDHPDERIRDAVRFDWPAMDAWFEEDEEVFVHPKDPYKRVDILPSSRHVRVIIDGTVVADSHRPWVLFETGLPPRYYLPKADVRMDLLGPTGKSTSCPYKGDASYWSVGEQPDIAWSYKSPTQESIRIAGLVSFYNEKIDIEVDGVLLDRPRSPFS
jgi:uncharacterized protein (DUF427 family)